ncbi:M1 family aminopeptidase [Mucilaginibacter sp. KACC 22773]|uniref:M1 family metallopeptidase n=1 Tax=Mucilaginibacter sp. KACC 22773 TaxID=3025671 RepID=UPI0023669CE6|nr:M1 family aminopeptidase [Mucilaginibacter sp. KACC 22773]WDF77196.1 M1 family aminopeptidase [Mucilaginibacter sp. KACC 22773]
MKLSKLILLLLTSNAAFCQQNAKPVPVEPGVSYQLAQYRHSTISNIEYIEEFKVPLQRTDDITGISHIIFDLKDISQPLQIDFKQGADHVKRIILDGGKSIDFEIRNEHIIIAPQYLSLGRNSITIDIIAGNESLNRNNDYLYALFVPDRARTVFPCFDQPDLKATFHLGLQVPKEWKVLANGTIKKTTETGEFTNYEFNTTAKLPTYLFSFTAGKYTDVKQTIGKRSAEFLYRETDSTKIKLSVDSIFKAHLDAINFLENWTGIPFPFQKVGFVAIPDFQFGGMEHPGEVQYKASTLFLDEGSTKDELIERSSVISHETAHMWFGDMVTMQWFNDVWMKEVFANFMADKVTEKLMGSETFNLKFLLDHYPAAYGIDRTMGANPIRQQLDNLQDAGSLYGNIIYHKAPIMMRQLESLMRKDNFQKGIRVYLKRYAYGNATWPDLIAILSKYTTNDLYTWNKVWVNQPGRPVFEYKISYDGNKIGNLIINQHPEVGTQRIWPQVFSITMVYADHSKTIAVNMNARQIIIKAAAGLAKPLFILFNSDGMGYGLFPVDKTLTGSLSSLKSPLQRASAYINAYENMLSGRAFIPAELLKLYQQGIADENNEMNLRLLTGYIGNIYWTFLRPSDRLALSAGLEHSLWASMEQQTAANNKKILFGAYQNIDLSAEAKKRIYQVWLTQKPPAGIKLAEDDYTGMALSIALKSDTPTSVLKQQQDRISNAERKARLSFLMPALSLNVQERDAFFNGLADRKNRAKEAWVATALTYLNHPLRQDTSIKYLPKSLELVEEIQRTGDVFFPQSWLGAVFGRYQSEAAYQTVASFLKQRPNYNSKLKDKILQATDNLYRAQKLLKN